MSGNTHLMDALIQDASGNELSKSSDESVGQGRKESAKDIKVVELAMQRWSGQHSRPFLFGILNDGTILCYHAYLFESSESKSEDAVVSSVISTTKGISGASRLRNLRFVRIHLNSYTRDEVPEGIPCSRITMFKNIRGHEGLFLSGSRPSWFMVFRERLRIHPQVRFFFLMLWQISFP